MPGDNRASVPNEIADFVEVVGVLLTAKLNETLKAAFAVEAEGWRINFRCALEELKDEFRLQESDNVEDWFDNDERETFGNRHASEPLQLPSQSKEGARTGSSTFGRCRSAQSPGESRRVSSHMLGERLADRVITAKLLTVPGASESRRRRRVRYKKQQTSFDGLVPIESKDTQTLPCQTSEQDSEHASDESMVKTSSITLVNDGTGKSPPSPVLATMLRPSPGVLISPQMSLKALHSNSRDSPIIAATTIGHSLSMAIAHVMSQRSRPSAKMNRALKGWKEEAKEYFHRRPSLVSEWWGPTKITIWVASRVLGLLPWNTKLIVLSRMYQVAFALVLLLSTLSVASRLTTSQGSETSFPDFVFQIDTTLAIGSFLGLLASLLKNEACMECQFLVESYLSRADFLEELNLKSCIEHGALLMAWLACVGSRFYAHASSLDLQDFGFAFDVLVLLGMCAQLLRLCRGLNYIVDSFCLYITERVFDYEDAMQEWFLLHCTIRTACESLQMCFFVLQLTGMGMVLVGATSYNVLKGNVEKDALVECVPGAVCTLVLVYLSMRAASVTDLCRRVPMFVNSSSARFDLKRMYLVEYIVSCETGFYIFEVRLDSAILSKIFYVACAAVVTLLSKYSTH